MRLTVLDGYALNPGDLSWDSLKDNFDIKVYDRTPANNVVERIGDSEAILINKVVITKEILDQCPNLKYIGVMATGYNVVDTATAHEKGIVVTNVPAYSTDAVAQHVFSFITYFSNHVSLHNDSVHNDGWVNSPDFAYWNKPLMELSGKTLGIFGYGSIGRKVAEIGKAFGMKILVHSRTQKPDMPAIVSKEELFAKSDIITLHAPQTPETTSIINKQTISLMKPSCILINTARGGLVNETELSEALNNDKIAGYACDVVSLEPMSKENPLLKAKNCVITPHIAWAPIETRQRLMNVVVKNIVNWFNGKPQNQV